MKYKIEKEGKAPAYLQLYKQIREDIVSGAYRYNSKLPSKRLIAAETGISVITIEHTYALLAEEGYIEPRERSGYFVVFRPSDGFAHGGEGVLSHSPTVKRDTQTELPFPLLARTMRRVISDCGERIMERCENKGSIELRQTLKRYLAASRGISVDTEQIVIGSGSEYLYGLVTELLGKDKLYAVEFPTYRKIEQLYGAMGINYEKLPMGKNGIESSFLWESRADILHISPYRSFPSGITADASKRHEYVHWAARRGGFIIEDDYESEFSISQKPEDTVFSLSDKDNVIYMNTFTRTVSPSIRVGYMLLPKSLVKEFDERLGFYSCTVPTFFQLVLAELIANGDFERHINRVRRAKRREIV